jgi:hypothetical protein
MPVPPESGIWNAAVGTAPATVAKAATASILLLVRPLGAGASAYASRNIMCLSIDLVLRPRCSCTCSCGSRGVALQVGSPCVRPAWDMGTYVLTRELAANAATRPRTRPAVYPL